MVRNLFENQGDNDRCPFCGAPGGTCNDSIVNDYRILNPETGATILVESDIYEDVVVNGEMEPRLKWKTGEFITPAEADRLGVRQVPFIVRLAREGRVLEEALGMQGIGENKMWRPAEDKAEAPVEDKAEAPKPEAETEEAK